MATVMEGSSSNINLSVEDVKNLVYLLEAFGSLVSPDDMASAYCRSGNDLHKAGEMLYNMLGSSSNDDVHISTTNGLTSQPARSRSYGVSVGTVSGVIGADYWRIKAKSKETSEITKPVKKLMLNEFVVSEMCDEKPVSVNNATTETMNKDVELFLLKMLGNGFQLDMEAIRKVLGGCGYDVRESMVKLLNISTPTLDLGDITSSIVNSNICRYISRPKHQV